MNIVHVTHNPDWFHYHFTVLCRELGHAGETFHRPFYDMDEAVANSSWRDNVTYLKQFDAGFVSHLATWSRMFLQNNWDKPLFVWLYFRFDHGVSDCARYYALLRQASKAGSIKLFAATESDKLYAQKRLGIEINIVPPVLCVNNGSKTKIPITNDQFFMVGKANEALLRSRVTVPVYHHKWADADPDLRGIRGIVHFPYAPNPRSLWENLALGNVYFLPDLSLFQKLRRAPEYFWDSYGEDSFGFSKTVWYNEDSTKLFVHYASFEELQALADSPSLPELLAEKRANIQAHVKTHNLAALKAWTGVLTV